jgi:hypothetical protein
MNQVTHTVFMKMNTKHRENLVQYRKAMAAFILKTEVRFLCVFLVAIDDISYRMQLIWKWLNCILRTMQVSIQKICARRLDAGSLQALFR